MRPFWSGLLIVLGFLPGSRMAQALEPQTFYKNNYAVADLILEPNPPEVGDQRVTFRLLNEQRQPISDAEVEVGVFMPAMGTMPAMSNSTDQRSLAKRAR